MLYNIILSCLNVVVEVFVNFRNNLHGYAEIPVREKTRHKESGAIVLDLWPGRIHADLSGDTDCPAGGELESKQAGSKTGTYPVTGNVR
jgi:hypothetical protein